MERRSTMFLNDATATVALVNGLVIKPDQGRQLLVDKDELPREFIEEDTTVDESLADEEKPTDEAQTVPGAAEPPGPAAPETATAADVTPEIVRQMIGKESEEEVKNTIVDEAITSALSFVEASSGQASALASMRKAAEDLELMADAEDEPRIVQLAPEQAKALGELGRLGKAMMEVAGWPVVVELRPSDDQLGLMADQKEAADRIASAALVLSGAAEALSTAAMREIPVPVINLPAIQVEFPEMVEELEVTARDGQGRVKQATKRIRRKEQT